MTRYFVLQKEEDIINETAVQCQIVDHVFGVQPGTRFIGRALVWGSEFNPWELQNKIFS